jgi:hypothetical protein
LIDLLTANGWTSATFSGVAKPYRPSRPSPAPSQSPAPTPEFATLEKYTQSERTTWVLIVKPDSSCQFGGDWWSSCQPCTFAPNPESQTTYKDKCDGVPVEPPTESASCCGNTTFVGTRAVATDGVCNGYVQCANGVQYGYGPTYCDAGLVLNAVIYNCGWASSHLACENACSVYI